MVRIIKGIQMNIHANFHKDRTTGKYLKIGGTKVLKKEEKGSSGPIWLFSKNHNFFLIQIYAWNKNLCAVYDRLYK